MKIKFSRFRKNILSGFLAYSLNTIIILVTYPIYLKYLGYEMLGLWATFSIIITLGEAGNLGVSETMMKFLAQFYHSNDVPKLKEYLNTGIIVVLLSGIFIFVIIVPLKLPIIKLLNIPNNYVKLANDLILFVGLISFTQIILSYLRGILAGIQRLDISNTLLVGTNLTRVMLMLLLLQYSSTLWSVVNAYLIANSLSILVNLFLIKKYLGFNFLDVGSIKKSVFIELVTFGGNISGSKFFSMIFIPFSKGFIAKYIGLTEVGYFEISWKMIYHLRNLMQKGLLAFIPKVSELHSQEKYKQIFILVKKSFIYSSFFSVLFLLGVYFFSGEVLNLWLGKDSNSFILSGTKILVISSSFSLLFVPHYYALLGIGKSRIILFEGIIKTTMNILFLIISVRLLSNVELNHVFYSVMFSIIIANIFIFISYQKIKKEYA